MNELPDYNTGLIPDITPSLWMGADNAIPYEVRLESGDWRPFVVRHEKQKDPLETMACVSFSCNNCLEIQYLFFGIDVNFSDRLLAKTSDTQQNGNTLERVNDTARNGGLVLETEWPNKQFKTWAEYYADIPQDVLNKRVKQDFQYQWTAVTPENLKKQLKQSPLQITIPAPHPYHAVTLLHIDGDKAYIQDHYSYQIRQIKVSAIAVALKVVLTKPNMTNSKLVKQGSTYGYFDPATAEDALISAMRNRGITPPLKADGKLDWDKVNSMVDFNLPA